MFNFIATFSYGLKNEKVELKASSRMEALGALRAMGHNMGRIENLKQH